MTAEPVDLPTVLALHRRARQDDTFAADELVALHVPALVAEVERLRARLADVEAERDRLQQALADEEARSAHYRDQADGLAECRLDEMDVETLARMTPAAEADTPLAELCARFNDRPPHADGSGDSVGDASDDDYAYWRARGHEPACAAWTTPCRCKPRAAKVVSS